jgi:predicted ribosome quality control (RQC) complex YloA/Tae2 family protein
MKTCVVNDHVAKIGQNAQENWNLLTDAKKDESKETYWFFHLSAFPSCYVIWECDDENPPLEAIKELARICLLNTKHKNAKNIKVDYTQCKNVEKGDVIGEVSYVSKRKVFSVRI